MQLEHYSVTLNRAELVDIPDSKGETNLVIKCKFCGRSGTVAVVAEKGGVHSPYDAEHSGDWLRIAELE
jgi:hypothetical protein